MNDRENRQDRLTLELLTAIDQRSDLSQRHLARSLGVALGLANSYLKRCVRKGFVKIREAPANRYIYYLTPIGFAEKARLTALYLSSSLSFYRQAAEACTRAFEHCARDGRHRVLLCGLSDLAEIALLRARESDIEIVGVFDPNAQSSRFFSLPVWRVWEQVQDHDMCLLTDLTAPLTSYQALVAAVGKGQVWVPDVLGLTHEVVGEREDHRAQAR